MAAVATPGEPRTIVEPGNGTGSLSVQLPPGVTIDLEAVLANIDATGAGGPVTATLSVSEQSGVVIAEKRQSETINAGIVGTATWALRLTDKGGSTPVVNPADALHYGFLQFQTNRPGAPVTVLMEQLDTIVGTKANGVTTRNLYARALTSTVAAADFLTLTYKNGSGTVRNVALATCEVQDTATGAIERVIDAAAPRNVANGATDAVAFAHLSGPALLSYATPTNPAFVAGGLYAVTIRYTIDFWT